MTRAQLISAVALRMDEITPSAGLSVTVDGSDNNPLATLIDGIIDDGVLELFTAAPYWRLPQTSFTAIENEATNEIKVDDFDSRKIILLKVKNDFLRIGSVYCDDFQRPITEVYPEQSAEGKRQYNKYLMGKEAKPVAVMSSGVWDSVISREIKCFSLSAATQVTKDSVTATYVAKPATIVDDTDGVAPDNSVPVESVVPPMLIPALEWLLASRTFGARGDAGHADICRQNAQNLLV